MPNSFSGLKKNRSKSFEALNDQLQKMNSGGYSNDDDKYWKLTVDKAGNGYAVIRFLPAPANEDMPFVQYWDHGFQGPGGWYIENSLTTIGKDDPVSEFNSQLWNNGTDAGKEQARKQKRRLNYVANIYVVKDTANPENEGKVFLFKFGKKIFEKLNSAMNPEFEDEEAVNPFDFWEGASFKLKARNNEGGYRSYEPSSFDTPGVLTTPKGEELSDEELENIWNQENSLQEIIDPKNFKPYEELKAKLYRALALDGGNKAPQSKAEDEDEKMMDFKPKFKEKSEDKKEETSAPSYNEDDDDDMAFFSNLTKDD